MVDKKLIKSAIVAKGYTYETLSGLTGISVSAFSKILNNHRKIKTDEMKTLIKVLEISNDDIKSYFFCEKNGK